MNFRWSVANLRQVQCVTLAQSLLGQSRAIISRRKINQSRKLKCSVSLSSFMCYHSKLAFKWISLSGKRSEKTGVAHLRNGFMALHFTLLSGGLSNLMLSFGKCGHSNRKCFVDFWLQPTFRCETLTDSMC